ncbi:cytochrome P450, family 78, subfamily A, polypeptide 7 [Hibiscus trionum]|uniref:Cytochrome P450, family 78, subfamily A, polypeptide 7 n=1 Tax=Hibiscus trionum TaxID=183268 RepID=A0A9W7I315_HIBTR|nr:cytochrome P450, family 78, subfamily A, polypeptide 7 [Hibiscus trionum]
MELGLVSKDTTWWVFTLPAFFGSKNLLDAYVLFSLFMASLSIALLSWAFSVGGIAWKHGRNRKGTLPIPGPRGLPVFGSLFTLSRGLAHRSLAAMAWSTANTQLMAFSLGSTPVVVASHPHTAREILTSPHFADRPIKQSAKSLMFSRAIGFAPNGTYWRLLRRIASSHLFAPKRIMAHEPGRQLDCTTMLRHIANEQKLHGSVYLRKHLQFAALNNIMGSVFGKRYELQGEYNKELEELRDMVREGFELLGAFNCSDYLPWLSYFYDPFHINHRCLKLVPRVRKLVKGIIEQHQQLSESKMLFDNADFVDVLLSLDGDERLQEDDMVAVLWEMIFRGTDTTALLTEWVMAELVLHPGVQAKLQLEIDSVVTNKTLTDADVAKLPYLEAVIKETLRIHPPGPLLSWARLSTSDVQLSNGMLVPANTTAMVNMWAITHDPSVWNDPLEFKPERFLEAEVDVRGGDLRLAPFGAGRRVCPGKNLGLVTVNLWVAKLVQHFKWVQDSDTHPVDLSEVLKLSCEMKFPLHAIAVERDDIPLP